MDSLIRRIKQRFRKRGDSADGNRVITAAFGKHPGWDDHMDDIGLETSALVAVKRILYVQGIGKNIDSGKWAELESRQSAIEFGHTFIWCRADDIIAGRLWPSSDGRGRTSYPMVVCAHCRQVPLRWVHDCVMPRFEQLEIECRASRSPSEVRACLSACKETLQTLLDVPGRPEQIPCEKADALTRLTDHSELGLDSKGVMRVLYHIDREISTGPVSSVVQDQYGHSAHARVPTSSSRIADNSILWTSLLLSIYGQQTAVLVVAPQQETWLDIVVGEPAPEQLYCLRASVEALPLTSTVPYNIGHEFAERVKQKVGIGRTGGE